MNDSTRIPFNRPSVEGRELDYLARAIEGGHSSAKGPYSEAAASIIRDEIGAADVLLTTSCTAALEMAGMLLDIQPGQSVIVPSFTFVTTALAFVRAGARLVFADIEPDTLGIDPAHVEDLIDDTTRAIVPVHYAGVASDIEGLQRVVAGRPGETPIDIVEDNAHGLFSRLHDRPLGSFGRFATLSFHETKNFVCGEGGALIVNREEDVARAHVVFDKGTNRRAFLQGQVDKYTWVDTGSSFGMSDLLAAYLFGQLEARDRIMEKRRSLFEHYQAALEPAAERFGFRLPIVPGDRVQGYHMFYVLLPDRTTRDHCLGELNRSGFKATFHYVPLHDSAGAAQHLHKRTECPVTVDVSGRLLRLPFFNNLAHADADRIVECLLTALEAGA